MGLNISVVCRRFGDEGQEDKVRLGEAERGLLRPGVFSLCVG